MQELVNNWLAWHSYPKITALGHKDTADIFKGRYYIQEKIDGSQISFGKFNGELRIKGRNKEIVLDNPEKMFGLAVEIIRSVEDQLTDGYVYRGEYLWRPKHNALTYSRMPKNHIMLFDISDGLNSFVEPLKMLDRSPGFECIKLAVAEGNVTKELLDTWMNEESQLGGCKREGIVIKNYEQRLFGMPLFAKYVCDSFKETHKVEWKKDNPKQRDVCIALTAALKTDARWEKAIQHMRDRGDLQESPKDIGALIREIQDDTKLECRDMILEHLWNWAWPHISRGIVGRFPEWYKKRLADNVLGD